MGPLGEEFGWRGFLLKHFLSEWSILKSGLVLGVIWSVWHIPLFFIQSTVQHEISKMGLEIAIIGYLLYTVCISLLITVLYFYTDGNLLLCMVFHTSCNLSLGVVPVIMIKRGGAVLLITLVIVTFFILKADVSKKN